MNLFVAADNRLATIIGNVFTKDVKAGEKNLFYSDVVQGTDAPRRSVITFSGGDIFAGVEEYYQRSEQRPARFFQLDDEDYVFLTAQPDCDLEWFERLDLEAMKTLDTAETLALLETRHYRWECGCSEEKLLPMLAYAAKRDREDLFGEADSIRVTCPRCGAGYSVTREMLDKHDKPTPG